MAGSSMVSKVCNSSLGDGAVNCLSGDVGALSPPRAEWAACEAGGGC